MRSLTLLALLSIGCATAAAPVPHQVERVETATETEHHGGGHDWNDTYRAGTGFNLKPNGLLAKAIEGRKAGEALDVGMGQGRNAVFLATRGWSVTGVDTADEGIRIARASAAAAKVKLNAIVGDADSFDMGTNRYDLVALMYVGGAELSERIKTALKPGGVVVVEYFHKDMEAQFHHPMGAFATGELEGLFAGYQVLTSEVVDDVADFGNQKAKLVRFVAQKPQS